jgi:hypothetical protein
VEPIAAVTAPAETSVQQGVGIQSAEHAWRTIAWREGTNDKLRSRFARVRVRTAPARGVAKRGEETLLIEWPEGEREPTQYWLATVDKNTSFRALVDLAKMRWRVERDYLELKQEIGLGHYEGRGWPGFHHHGTLCITVLRVPDLRTGDNSPLRTSLRPEIQKNPPFPIVTDPAAPPIRPQRNVPNSSVTLHHYLIVAIARMLPRCPYCVSRFQKEQTPCFLTQYHRHRLAIRL